MHPDWEYMFWDNDAIAKRTFRNQRQIDASKEWAGKTDVMRYEILQEFGGIFSDADGECLRPLDDFFLDNDSFASWEQERLHPGLIANGTLGTTPGNELMRLMIEELERMEDVLPPTWKATGPAFLTRIVEQQNYDKLTVYPSYYFYPVHWTGMTYHGDHMPYTHQFWGSTQKSYNLGVSTIKVNLAEQLLRNARTYRPSDPQKAFVVYESLCEETDRSSKLHCLGQIGAAQCLRRMGKYDESFEKVQRAYDGLPSLLEAKTALAMAHWGRGDYDRAVPLLKSALETTVWGELIPEFPYRSAMLEEALVCCKNELFTT